MLRPPNPALAFKGPYGAFTRTQLGGGVSQAYGAETGTLALVLSGGSSRGTSVYGPGAAGSVMPAVSRQIGAI